MGGLAAALLLSMETPSAALLAAKCMGEFLAYHALGTVLFDAVHAFAHGLPRRALLSRWHSCHHKFQGTSLKVMVQFEADNVMYHMTPEWLTALVPAAAVAAAGTPLSWVQLTAIAYLAVRSVVFVVAGLIMKGQDSNHVELERVEVDKAWLLVGPHYHALHHVFPDRYLASFVKVLDYALGTAAPPHAGRRFVITGAGGSLGSAFAARLRGEGARVSTLKYGQDYARVGDDGEAFAFAEADAALDAALGECDVLLLCHGVRSGDAAESVRGNCHSQLALIERYRRCHEAARRPASVMYPEVWCVGTEAEFYPLRPDTYGESKREMMRHAPAYMQRTDLMNRHIDPAAFTSKRGPGLVSAEWVVHVSLCLISRGAQYVPASYTPFAYLHWFKMAFVHHRQAKHTLAKAK